MIATAAGAGDDEGVVFPRAGDGHRSTLETGRAVFADALRVASPTAAAAAEHESDWRRRYIVHARRLTEVAFASASVAQDIAVAGLNSARERLRFVRDGSETSLDVAMSAPRAPLATCSVVGGSTSGPAPLAIPLHGQLLSGDALRCKLDHWQDEGLFEPSFVAAIARVQAHPEWLDLSDQRIALLGAHAEMSPLPWLLQWRATVYAVDLPRPQIWQRLLRLAHEGNGTLMVPCKLEPGANATTEALAQQAGADLINDAPEIAAWLALAEGPLTVGAYAYLDSALHVRVSAAMDSIQARLAAQRRDITLAMLATPTDACAVPAGALKMAHARFGARGMAAKLAYAATAGRAFARNGEWLTAEPASDEALGGIVDALVVQQGPNYLLAKRLQLWRALVARSTGTRVSFRMAPPALTKSVTKNRLIAAVYRSADHFGAHGFEPATAAALMAAVLVHDLRHTRAVANPDVPLDHPLQLMTDAAFHGGLWRMPYAARAALPVAAVMGLLRG
jgi:hypothetical protein